MRYEIRGYKALSQPHTNGKKASNLYEEAQDESSPFFNNASMGRRFVDVGVVETGNEGEKRDACICHVEFP
ncbi:hypothetical protein L3Y34_012771 [Caenorhabditis briggsae]|uniref:Uncharacterized protein n=1 Tax=Caenorhabditis briggsae TaxID=6238 RepID=A0AAE8ZQ31_CAEBR|nr:hypothetical protein L3Y34_012771 [Caenorhabditis briggsae]